MTTTPELETPSGELMQWVLLPQGSVVHQNGIPVRLITGALVSVAHGNMQFLVGHHVCTEGKPPLVAAE